MSRRVALAAICLAGCGTPTRRAPPPDRVVGEDPSSQRAQLIAELTDEILTSYERDDPPDRDTGMLDPRIGPVRIGAGPGDVYVAGDLARAPGRWPLDVDHAVRTEVRSKLLAVDLAADLTAAWMSDEVSWRVELCGRIAVIPLRITALYAHDGDRWIPAFEHLSFGWTPTPGVAPAAKPIEPRSTSLDLDQRLGDILGRGLFVTPRDPSIVAQDRTGLVLGPDAADEWHGADVLDAQLAPGRFEGRRVGTVGRSAADATIAYWVGTYTADVPARAGAVAGPVTMRVTHIFEKRPLNAPGGRPAGPRSCARASTARNPAAGCRWVLVQSHVSQPITDEELTSRVFGTALLSPKPLALDCGAGVRQAP